MLYIVGLGLNEKGISKEGLEAVKKCKKIYLESYTVDFPYSMKDLEKVFKKKVIILSREDFFAMVHRLHQSISRKSPSLNTIHHIKTFFTVIKIS